MGSRAKEEKWCLRDHFYVRCVTGRSILCDMIAGMNHSNKLHLRLRPSRQVAALLLLMHGALMLAILMIHIAWWFNLAGGVVVVLSFVHAFRRHVSLLSPQSILELSEDGKGQWTLKTRSGQDVKAHLKSNSVSTNFILVMNFKEDKKSLTHTVLVCPDSISKDNYRRTKLCLERIRTKVI